MRDAARENEERDERKKYRAGPLGSRNPTFTIKGAEQKKIVTHPWQGNGAYCRDPHPYVRLRVTEERSPRSGRLKVAHGASRWNSAPAYPGAPEGARENGSSPPCSLGPVSTMAVRATGDEDNKPAVQRPPLLVSLQPAGTDTKTAQTPLPGLEIVWPRLPTACAVGYVQVRAGDIGNTFCRAHGVHMGHRLAIQGLEFAPEPVKASRSARCREALTEPGANSFGFLWIPRRWPPSGLGPTSCRQCSDSTRVSTDLGPVGPPKVYTMCPA